MAKRDNPKNQKRYGKKPLSEAKAKAQAKAKAMGEALSLGWYRRAVGRMAHELHGRIIDANMGLIQGPYHFQLDFCGCEVPDFCEFRVAYYDVYSFSILKKWNEKLRDLVSPLLRAMDWLVALKGKDASFVEVFTLIKNFETTDKRCRAFLAALKINNSSTLISALLAEIGKRADGYRILKSLLEQAEDVAAAQPSESGENGKENPDEDASGQSACGAKSDEQGEEAEQSEPKAESEAYGQTQGDGEAGAGQSEPRELGEEKPESSEGSAENPSGNEDGSQEGSNALESAANESESEKGALSSSFGQDGSDAEQQSEAKSEAQGQAEGESGEGEESIVEQVLRMSNEGKSGIDASRSEKDQGPVAFSDEETKEDELNFEDYAAATPAKEATSLGNRGTNPSVFWPKQGVASPTTAAKQAARLILAKVRQLSNAGNQQAPLVSGKRVVKELITRRYSLPKMRGKSITSKRKSLIMVDVSGSCSSSSPSTNAAAKAVFEAAPDLVVVMYHMNGCYIEHLGEMPAGMEYETKVTYYNEYPSFHAPLYWEANWGLVINFGDDDAEEQLAKLVEHGATLLQLDSYCKNVTGFQFQEKQSQKREKAHAKNGGRYLLFTGCDNADDLVSAMKILR